MTTTKQLYRYYEVSYEECVTIVLETFRVVKETDASYWYVPEHGPDKPRIVRKGATRSKCYDTREAAWASFKIRKHKQMGHLASKLRDLKWLLPQLDDWAAPVTTKDISRNFNLFKPAKRNDALSLLYAARALLNQISTVDGCAQLDTSELELQIARNSLCN